MYFSTSWCEKSSKRVFIRKQYGLPLHKARWSQHLGIAHRPPASAVVPVGLGAHNFQQRRQPAELPGRSVGHHQLVHGVDVVGNAPHILKGHQPAEDGRLAAIQGETQRRPGRGKVIAAEIQLIGHETFAGVDVLAVQVSLSPGTIQLFNEFFIPFNLEIGDVAADARHGVHAPDRAMAPGHVHQTNGNPAVLVVEAAAQQSFRREVILFG